MPQVDPYAYQNAFGAQQDRSLRNRVNDQQQTQQAFTNDLATRQVDARAVQQTRDNEIADQDRRTNLVTTQIAPFMQRALREKDPKTAFLSAIQNPQVRSIFEQAGFKAEEFDPNDPELLQDMQSIASLGAQEKPQGQIVPAGSSLIGPDGKPVYTSPFKPPDAMANDRFDETQRHNRAMEANAGTAGASRSEQRLFGMADKLRDEFNTQSKEFTQVGDNYNVVQATAKDNSAAGDLSMIFAYMKMLDPGSVVREQEFANAQNAAGIPERIRNAWNKALNGERLNPTQRADFVRQADNLYKTRKSRNDVVVNRYTDIAKRNGIDPQNVIGDMSMPSGDAPRITPDQALADPRNYQQPSAAPRLSPEQAAKLPPGTQFVGLDGKQRVKH